MTIRGIRDADVAATSLVARLAGGPLLFAPDIAGKRLQDWLSDVDADHVAELETLLSRFPKLRTILAGIAETSPYLFDLVRADTPRALRVLRSEPDRHLERLIEDMRHGAWTASSEAQVMKLLRSVKAEAALLTALCDIGGVWPVMRVTRALTDLATASVQSALRFLLREEAARKRILPPNPDRPEDGSGLIVLAIDRKSTRL